MTDKTLDKRYLPLAIVVWTALGYFVDMYGILLPMMLPTESFEGFNVGGSQEAKSILMSWQMGGIMLGGFVWGIWGDLKGRLTALSWAMLFYIIGCLICGNIAANPENFYLYKLGRFITGIGLSGELGAATTIACEVLSAEKRAKGVAVITAFGFMGGLFAYYMTHQVTYRGMDLSIWGIIHWQQAYFLGAGLAFCVWILRSVLYESLLYEQLQPSQKSWKNLFRLWRNRRTLILYLSVLLIGLPIWFRIGILINHIQSIVRQLGMSEDEVQYLKPDRVAFWMYVGVVLGNFICPILSDVLKSRKIATFIFMLISTLSAVWLLRGGGATTTIDWVLFKFFIMGIGTGYWGTFVMMSAEAFGTNVRCAVTSTTPNLIRGSLIPMLYIIQNYATNQLLFYVNWMAVVCFGVAFLAWAGMKETYGNDLDFVETFEK